MTEYVVFENNGDGQGWTEYGRAKASGTRAAIRAALNGDKAHNGSYVAVPTRSWQPVKATTRVQTTVVLEASH